MCEKLVDLQNQVQQYVQALLVACGYSQVSGVNFSENNSPIVNDAMFGFLLLMVVHFGFSTKIDKAKTASLYGYLEEKICIECPQCMSDVSKDDCIVFN